MSNPDVGSSVKPKREVKIAKSRLVIPEHQPKTFMPSRTCSSGTSSRRVIDDNFTNFDLQNLQFGVLYAIDFLNTYNLEELCELKPPFDKNKSEELLNDWLKVISTSFEV